MGDGDDKGATAQVCRGDGHPKAAPTCFFERKLFLLAGVFFLFASVGFLLYRQVILRAPFLFDDFEYIVGNPMVTTFSYFTNIADARYLGYLSFALNYAWGGQSPEWFHLTNVIIHVVNAMLVFGMVTRLLGLLSFGGERDAGEHAVVGFFAGLIFLVHPIETQAVSYVTQRFTSLSSLFYLMSVVLYLEARIRFEAESDNQRAGYVLYLLSVTSAIFAMKTKEIAFTIPFMIAVLELLLFERSKFEKRRFYFLVPFAATLVIIPLSLFGPRWGLSGPGAGVEELARRGKLYDLSQRSAYLYLITQFRVIVTYIRLLVFPVHQIAVYDYPLSHSFFEPRVVLSFVALLALGGAAIFSWRTSRRKGPREASYLRLFSLGVVWFFVTISVESSVIPIKDIIFEHRVYLPSPGFFASFTGLLGLAVMKVWSGRSFRTRVAALALLVVVPLSVATYARNIVWTNEIKFWDDVVRKTGKAIGYNNRGDAYLKKGEYELALRDLNTTIGFFPRQGGRLSWNDADFTPSNMAKTYFSRGQIYRDMGDEKRAEEDFAAAEQLMAESYGSVAGSHYVDVPSRGRPQ
jgi:hypothetical protein